MDRQPDVALYDALERAFRGKEYRLNQDNGLRPSKRLTQWHPHQLPVTYADITSSDDESQDSGSPQLGAVADGLPAGAILTPPALQRDELPPTPPTLTNSEDLAPPRSETLAANPEFANAVRIALHAERSCQRLNSPAPHGPPDTPEASPPSARRLGDSRLHLPQHHPHILRAYPSSRADSYHTARETRSSTQLHLSLTSSPAASRSEFSSDGHTEKYRDLFFHPGALQNDGYSAEDDNDGVLENPPPRSLRQTSVHDRLSDDDISPAPRNHQLGASSSVTSSDASTNPRQSLRIAHHLDHTTNPAEDIDERPSFVRGPAIEPGEEEAADAGPPPGLDLSMPYASTPNRVSVEDVNNLVYQHIQQVNVNRHSFVDGLIPMPVGIIAMHEDKHRPLKRAPRCLSLRENASEGSPRSSVDSSLPKLRHTQRSLQSSPVIEKEKLHRSPAHASQLNISITSITALTQNALVKTRGAESERPRTPSLEHRSTLRRSHKIDRFERTSFPETGTAYRRPLPDQDSSAPPVAGTGRKLRHFSRENKLENNPHIGRTSLESFSPRRKDFDLRFSHPTQTPMSQFSDRTEAEVLEARGVSIYPHNNGSLLVVENGSRPTSKDDSTPVNSDTLEEAILAAHPSSPVVFDVPAVLGHPPRIHVASPLTNPRTAPDPPAFRVIPPTPNDELDRQLAVGDNADVHPIKPQRHPSLLQKARRYSESFVQPFLGRSNSRRAAQQSRLSFSDDDDRPANLSPFWRPRYFWEDVDSDEEYDEEECEIPVQSTLPRGGDTSNTGGARRLFPHSMSVRMPGFRGGGGFLVGNSLGLDRHGTNNRRHHVARRCASQEVLRQAPKGRRVFTLPFTGGVRLQYVGMAHWRRRMTERRQQKQDWARERRCQTLREQIQHFS